MKRWGEYVAVIATSLFLPLEIHELILKLTVLRVAALAINLFLVAYLVLSKRLFGVRGGGKAFEAERENTSLLEVELAATGQRLRRHGGGGAASDNARHVAEAAASDTTKHEADATASDTAKHQPEPAAPAATQALASDETLPGGGPAASGVE